MGQIAIVEEVLLLRPTSENAVNAKFARLHRPGPLQRVERRRA
jgi:hypothetical protein